MKSFLFSPIAVTFAAILGLATSSSQAQPGNDMFANGTLISGTSLTVTGSSVDATSEPMDPYPGDVWSGCSVWWTWTAPADGTVTISTIGSSFDTVLGVYTGSSISMLTEVTSNDDEDDSGDISTSQVQFMADAGQTYHIMVAGYDDEFGDGPESGSIMLTLDLAPPQSAPAWLLPDLDGRGVTSATFAGKVVILDFWATWCGPCRAEIPDLIALHDKYQADGLVIIGASVDTSAQTVKDFMAGSSPAINYRMLMATWPVRQAYGGIQYIPTTFIIDRQNIVRARYVGTQSGSSLEKRIIPLLYGDTRLNSRADGDLTVLSWPANSANFTLESSNSLENNAWTAWPATPTVADGLNQVSLPKSEAARFFRLRMAY